MGYPTEVQRIKRKGGEQYDVNFPSAIARAMDFRQGEVVVWQIEDRGILVLKRREPPPSPLEARNE